MRVHPDDRKKRHHTKSRHGCISCKKRHLRCDEAPGSCQRCLKDFGNCEGYLTPKTWTFQPTDSTTNNRNSMRNGSSPKGSEHTSSYSSPQTASSLGSPPENKKTTVSSESEPVRQKRWAPKSKSGCLTCKHRRIKCDEQRPCNRCSKSNRDCEYADQASDEVPSNTLVLESSQNKGKLFENPCYSLLFQYINHTPYKTQIEHQTLVHWQNRTESCMAISRTFGNVNILGRDLPQGAWTYKCLRHGLLSAASVTASVELFAVGDDNEKKAVVEALNQSNLAISSMLKEKPPPEITVLIAFCFWFMEAWIGSWDRAVMHLASSAKMCEQRFAAGQISEQVAWYVELVNTSVPQALRSPEILKLAQNANDGEDDNFCSRLLWGIREAITGIQLLDQVTEEALRLKPNSCGEFHIILASHQAQMRFLSERWKRYAKVHFKNIDTNIQLPPPPVTPVYTKAIEMMDYFLAHDARYDSLVLGMRLKMIQRSLPLFIAGTNFQIRRDAALSIPIKVDSVDPE